MLSDANMIPVNTAEFVVGLTAILVAGFIFIRFLTPVGLFLAQVAIAAGFAAAAFDGNEADTGRLVIASLMALAAFVAWYRDIRPRRDLHRNAIFGFGQRGADQSREVREQRGTK